MSRFLQHYELLGIRPGVSWPGVRTAYKSRMRQWHPDRFIQDKEASRHAEEMSKRVNQAYQEIASYYEEHGCLPLNEPVAAPLQHSGTASEPGAPKSYHDLRKESQAPPVRKSQRVNSSSLFMTIAILALLISIFWQADPATDSFHDNAIAINNQNQQAKEGVDLSAPHNPVPIDAAGSAARLIAVGSTLGEVYAIQGVPTRTNGDIWYYGSAQVVFFNGRVTHWVDSSPPVLRTSTRVQPVPASEYRDTPGFSRGSTREEVRAIQGNPLRETANVWVYGQSQVQFDRNGRVIGWTESPYDPLRIKR